MADSATGNMLGIPEPVLLVRSEHAGSTRDKRDPLVVLHDAHIQVARQVQVTHLPEACPLGERWRQEGIRAVVAAGGDGTVGSVVSHVMGSGLPLGILPYGTHNDTARSLGIPMDADAAARALVNGRPMRVDVGHMAPAHEPEARGCYFIQALTVGLQVEFSQLAADVNRRRRWGKLTYAVSFAEALASARSVNLRLRLRTRTPDGPRTVDVRHDALQLSVVNMPVVGGDLDIRVPGAMPQDRLLDVVVIRSPDRALLRRFADSVRGALTRRARAEPRAEPGTSQGGMPRNRSVGGVVRAYGLVCRYRAHEVDIETEHPVHVALDGEVLGKTPVCARIAPRQIPIYVPLRGNAITP